MGTAQKERGPGSLQVQFLLFLSSVAGKTGGRAPLFPSLFPLLGESGDHYGLKDW